MKQLTFNRVGLGTFDILVDGVRSTRWEIVNGCLGLSGRGQNIYVLAKDGRPTKIQGSLQMCKKAAVQILSKFGCCANGMEHQNCNDNRCACDCHLGKPWQDVTGTWHNLPIGGAA